MRVVTLVSVLALMAAAPAAFAMPAEPQATAASAAATPTYTSAQFYDTTSFGMAYSGAKAFSPDGA